MGVGSGRYRFDIPKLVANQSRNEHPKLTHVTPFHGCLVQGPFSLLSPDRSVQSILEFLKNGPITCDGGKPAIERRTSREQLILNTNGIASTWLSSLDIPGAQREPISTRICRNSNKETAILVGPAFDDTEPSSWKLGSFEFRLGLELSFEKGDQKDQAIVLGIPDREASRRFQHLRDLLEEKNHTFYVDSGSFLDGSSSVRDGALSLHRQLTLSMLSRLGATALAPGDTELVAGAQVLVNEARESELPYVATNWETEEAELELPKYLIREVPDPLEPIRLAFLAIVDPEIARWAPQLVVDGVKLTDPVDAINQTVHELYQSDEPPDFVVVLTTGTPQTLTELKSGLSGVDLVIGDKTGRILRTESATIHIEQRSDPDRKVAALIPVEDIASADLTFARQADRWVLSKIEYRPHRVRGDFPPDPEVLAEVTGTRAKVYLDRDRLLLPPPPGPPETAWKGRDWTRTVCESVLKESDADIMLLPNLPEPPAIPGPLTELLVMDRLALLDRLEEHRIPGDKIKNLLPEGSVSSDTRLVLTNAVYFNAAWANQFEDFLTQDEDFSLLDGSSVTVPMMSQTEYFHHVEGSNYHAVELLYDGGELSMVIMIPDEGSFDTFEASLDAAMVTTILESMSSKNVHLKMPRFEFEGNYALVSHLRNLGMKDAFLAGSADFSGIDGTQDLLISNIIHKSFISVKESGTEAAAATAVTVGVTSVPPTPTEVHIDRPFLFFIRDIKTEAMVFFGRVVNPE